MATESGKVTTLRGYLAERVGQVAATDDPEATLRLLVEVRDLADNLAGECVRAARAQGYTWEHVGSLVGVTKQAAQQRWG